MAKRYFDAELLPEVAFNARSGIRQHATFKYALVDSTAWWVQAHTLESVAARLDSLFGAAYSCGPYLDIWGVDPGNRIFLYRNENLIESMLIRFDMENVDTIFMNDVCGLACVLECKLRIVDTQETVTPNLWALWSAIRGSDLAHVETSADSRTVMAILNSAP